MELRPGYKQTEVGVIPEEWEAKRLGDASVVVMGQSPAGRSYNRNGVGLPLINGPTEFTEDHPIKIQWTSEPSKLCRKGDLLLCVRGSSTGRINISDDEYCIGRGVAVIRAKSDSDTSFVTFQVRSAVQNILAATTGSTFPNIDGKSIRAIEIPLPPLSEQRAIAGALRDVDVLLGALTQLIAKKRDLKQAAMQRLLTGHQRFPGFTGQWEAVTAGEIGRFRGGNGFPLRFQGKSEGRYPFYKVSDMNNEGNETFMTTSNNWISESIRKALGATPFPANSIVFAKVGAAIFLERKKILTQSSCIDNNMTAFVLNADRADCHFVHYLFLETKLSALVATTALPSLNGKQLSGISVALPPLPEQTAIAAVLSDMDSELGALEQRQAKTRALKQGMMQELLTGRTRLV